MPYCSKCGKELADNQKFCHGCGKQILEKTNKFVFKKKIFIFVGILILLIILFFVFSKNRNIKTGDVLRGLIDKEECPYECCLEGKYFVKQCIQDYECISNKCEAVDSDGDKLTNIEEREIGTDPNLYDTDGDTLNDYKEYIIFGTNPLNKNTDTDRYDDNEDSDPLNKNSAYINTKISSKSWNWDIVNIALLIATFGVLNPDMILAEPEAIVVISNIGDDYSSYINFDLIFEVSNVEIRRQYISFNKMGVGETLTKTYQETITLRDMPDMILNLAKEKTSDWNIKIENLDYESF